MYVVAANIADARTTLAQTEQRLAASKRYRGRIQDVRWADAVRAAIADYEAREAEAAEAAEVAAWEAEDIEATRVAYEAEQEFRSRVATRAYFAAQNGEAGTDEERWLRAEAIQRRVDSDPPPVAFRRVAGRDWYDSELPRHHYEGEWMSPSERRRADRRDLLQ